MAQTFFTGEPRRELRRKVIRGTKQSPIALRAVDRDYVARLPKVGLDRSGQMVGKSDFHAQATQASQGRTGFSGSFDGEHRSSGRHSADFDVAGWIVARGENPTETNSGIKQHSLQVGTIERRVPA